MWRKTTWRCKTDSAINLFVNKISLPDRIADLRADSFGYYFWHSQSIYPTARVFRLLIKVSKSHLLLPVPGFLIDIPIFHIKSLSDTWFHKTITFSHVNLTENLYIKHIYKSTGVPTLSTHRPVIDRYQRKVILRKFEREFFGLSFPSNLLRNSRLLIMCMRYLNTVSRQCYTTCICSGASPNWEMCSIETCLRNFVVDDALCVFTTISYRCVFASPATRIIFEKWRKLAMQIQNY